MFVVYTSIYQLNWCFVHIYNAWHVIYGWLREFWQLAFNLDVYHAGSIPLLTS